jgi:hypothetical protein
MENYMWIVLFGDLKMKIFFFLMNENGKNGSIEGDLEMWIGIYPPSHKISYSDILLK